jgi:hypothetical protein
MVRILQYMLENRLRFCWGIYTPFGGLILWALAEPPTLNTVASGSVPRKNRYIYILNKFGDQVNCQRP